MSLTKMVNGQPVACSAEEEAAIRAEWTANAVFVPQVITMRQARVALIDADLDDDVEAAIDAIADAKLRKKVRATWEKSSEVHRNQAFVLLMQAALGWSDAMIDALFISAAAQ